MKILLKIILPLLLWLISLQRKQYKRQTKKIYAKGTN